MSNDAPTQQPQTGYEFQAHENTEFVRLASVMRFVARFQVALGTITVVATVLALLKEAYWIGLILLAQVALNVLCGWWVLGAAKSFQEIVDTQGSDVSHLMTAINKLRKIFTFQRGLILVALLVAAVGTIALGFAGSGAAPPSDGAHGGPPVAPAP